MDIGPMYINLYLVKIEWKKIVYENSAPNSRFGHTALIYQKKMILFGGRSKLNNYSFNADIEVFNIGKQFYVSYKDF